MAQLNLKLNLGNNQGDLQPVQQDLQPEHQENYQPVNPIKQPEQKIQFKNEKINENYHSLTEEEEKEINKRYRSLKLKKILTTTFLIIFLVCLLIFGTYNTFLKKEKSASQITAEVNSLNQTTPFPSDGVYGFLSLNINALLDKNIQFQQGTNKFTVNPGDLFITNIAKKDAYIANVYFTARITTNSGNSTHNFVVPIKYDWEKGVYSVAGQVALRPVNNTMSTVPVANEQLKFADGTMLKEDETTSAKNFVNNFLLLVYNEDVDIKQFYTGPNTLNEPNAKFVEITNFEIHSSPNKNGYNCYAEYTLRLTEGLQYSTKTYFDIVKDGKSSWKIKKLL